MMRRMNSIFEWNDKHTKCFEKIKFAIINYVTLAHPNYIKPFIIFTDASDIAMGAILSQYSDKHKTYVPIRFGSRKFNDIEKENMSSGDKEFAATIWAMEKFKNYLIDKKFYIFTDHKNLIYNLNALKVSQNIFKPKYSRWMNKIIHYDYEVGHIPGTYNIFADYLSRYINFDKFYDMNNGPEKYVLNDDLYKNGKLINNHKIQSLAPEIKRYIEQLHQIKKYGKLIDYYKSNNPMILNKNDMQNIKNDTLIDNTIIHQNNISDTHNIKHPNNTNKSPNNTKTNKTNKIQLIRKENTKTLKNNNTTKT